MKLVTVLTPSYNRGKNLKDLFESLQKQSSYNFIWMVVDDGSKDETETLVKSYIEKANFELVYIKKNNGGKHTALNEGIKKINTTLTFIVDSDDTLLPNAISTIEDYFDKYKDNADIGVFSFLRCKKDGTPIVKAPQDEFVGSYIQTRIVENLPGDMAEVYFTHTLKEFPFPEFPNERFLSEDIVWIQIGEKYKYVFVNKPIYQCEYLEGGLTDSDKSMKFASPLGSMMRGKMLMKKVCGLKVNFKGAIIYNCYKTDVNEMIPEILELQGIYEKFLAFITYPLGKVFYRKWRVN